MGEKPWQLTGEIAGPARPENSLLQEHLEYDTAARQAPVITEEVSRTVSLNQSLHVVSMSLAARGHSQMTSALAMSSIFRTLLASNSCNLPLEIG